MQRKKTRPPAHWTSIIHRCSQTFINEHLQSELIGSGQFPFLMELYSADGVSQDDLANTLMLDRGTAARALEVLEQRGFIRRERDPSNRRKNRVFLTEKAFGKRREMTAIAENWRKILSTGLDAGEQAAALPLLEKMATNAMQNRVGNTED
jgi:DNA-binding MarR family transcriptional regulator